MIAAFRSTSSMPSTSETSSSFQRSDLSQCSLLSTASSSQVTRTIARNHRDPGGQIGDLVARRRAQVANQGILNRVRSTLSVAGNQADRSNHLGILVRDELIQAHLNSLGHSGAHTSSTHEGRCAVDKGTKEYREQ